MFTIALAATVFSLSAQDLTLDDIMKSGKFRQKSVYGLRSMNDGLHYTSTERGENGNTINKYSYETGEKIETILSEGGLRDITGDGEATIEGYRFSDDEKYLIVSFDVDHIYRHSTKEKYYIVDLQKREGRLLSKENKQRHATISPDGSKVAYVQDNDLYYQDMATGSVTRVTSDGEYNKIINGFADWVYEEEFAFDQAFAWSPDGSKLAFYRFDESNVVEFHMPKYGGLYPEDYKFKYPKAGEDNSEVKIGVYDLKSGSTKWPELGEYEYIPRIKWTQSSDYLAVMKMPRLQNQLEILLVNSGDMSTQSIYKESSETYIEISDDLTFFDDNAGFIWRSEKDGFFHLYSYDFAGKNEKQLTSGSWEVKSFLGYSSGSRKLFFSASKTSPINTAIYSIGLDGGEPKLLSPEDGNNRAAFSSTFEYFILYHNTANEPYTITLRDGDGNTIRTLEENKDLKAQLKEMKLSEVEFFDFKTSEGVSLNGWMMKPNDFNPKNKYPVLMYVYGGPGSQTVTNGFSGNYWWHQMMTQKGYIIVSVDNRGTGARGKEFRTQTYRQLGKYETMDQIEAAKWLGSQDYVDADRIGIWGWSYGGYMSSLCLFKGAEHFKAAVAVAPVSNWRYYDNIYTERYMGLPQDNGSGYDDNSPINHVDKLNGNYLLIHGTADDNVHYQNAVEMVNGLISADKQFDFYIYPDRNHGIYGGNTRHHLFTKITNFITTNL